ncbi:type II toxin-antitoxin system Phd/YefM family antitoxin [Mobiluncus mulieris]|uniref:type II toxin-antitoxin system Phd/YefM family antitoxin n=1 Tax=Mobiluncus mulieris TaxID=2052 RepID=UPI0021E273FE|nr:type II toxin-antitoxin system Phd/YefM family antitoxin [Mobiluncus mulieris]MCV0002220.1 type II toxin-antitoxin system Phd/YefM family antitoxin [Mobiluncus mulieris]
MQVNTDTLVSITEANQNFSKVARLVDQYGSAVILKNNTPRYVVMEFAQVEKNTEASDTEVNEISQQLMKRNTHVYQELAK